MESEKKPMQTLLVRLKAYDPRRGNVLRRFTYAGIKFHEERGWYRVTSEVAEYLRHVRQVPGDEYSGLAFDVHTEEEAAALDTREEAETKVRRAATDTVQLSAARGALTSADVNPASHSDGAPPEPPQASGKQEHAKGKKER